MELNRTKSGNLSPVRSALNSRDNCEDAPRHTKCDKDEAKHTRARSQRNGSKKGGGKKEEEGRGSRSSSKSDREKSPNEDSAVRRERIHSRSSDSAKDTNDRITGEIGNESPKVSRKYFTNWRQACDKTKDKTKELLKRWRTLPEGEGESMPSPGSHTNGDKHGWSVHVWTTWVNRCSEDLECLDLEDEQPLAQLSAVQSHKMTLFFAEILDHDCDNVITDNDFDNFFEKLAHFADWSSNSSEFHIMIEVKREFVEQFIDPLPPKWSELPYYKRVCGPDADTLGLPGRTTLEGWLARWALHLAHVTRFTDLPLYLQYFCKILFHVVDRTNSGAITKAALASFYRSVIGLNAPRVEEIIDTAYDRMTSKGYLILDYGTYVHCFTNWLMGKNPNGPGQWVLVPPKDSLPQPPFPVDYSAFNTDPEKLEPYIPDKETKRHSVIV